MVKHFTHLCRHIWRTPFWRTLFVNPVHGNPLHEAWDQHGEPLPRQRSADPAHSSGFCDGIHARGV